MSDEELKQLIISNAKASQALSSSLNELQQEWEKDRLEWKKDRKQMYEWLARLSASQANFWETQADYYRRLEDVEERQATMLEILNRLTKKEE
jgi:leucyl aminopeptidase (aminopeptidase T)